MIDFIGSVYLWIKAIHVIFVISWMAALFYLPRLFVYHAGKVSKDTQELFKTMEHRLSRIIMLPAMIGTWVTGLLLGYYYISIQKEIIFSEGWLHSKFLLVILMSGYHGYLVSCLKKFKSDSNKRPPKFYRFLNEIPTLLMILIVIMVIVKPF